MSETMSETMRGWQVGSAWLRQRRFDAFLATLRAPRDAARLARWRDARLRLLLAHARQHVPLFRQPVPSATGAIEELRRFPVLTRRDYQKAGVAETMAVNIAPERLLDRSTSGSTGERMVVRRTWLEERLLNCFKWRVFRDYGVGRHDRLVNALFRNDIDPRDDQRLARLAMRLGWRQMLVVDALGDDAATEKTARFAPHCLTGMTSALASLAASSVACGMPLSPRMVVTTGELLTAPLRSAIEVLGSPIRDLYGANELNVLAWQCPAGNATYHVCDDAVVLEVLGADGNPVGIGETGEVVVTGLHSFAMPFIRYKIGDLAVRGPERCPCGAPWSTLEAIGGRTIDFFPLSGGRSLHPWTIHNAVRPWLGRVRQASLVQTAADELEYLVVAPDALGAAEEKLLGAAARSALPAGVGFTLRRVDAIPAGPGGKARPFVALAAAGGPTK
jgi:phenylacetate-CoA ligase